MKEKFPSLAIKAVIAYMIIGEVWMVLFGFLIPNFISDPVYLLTLQKYADSFFILVSAIAIGIALNYQLKSHKNTEQSYQNIIDHAVDGIFQSTITGQFISVNRAMAHLYGYDSPKEMCEQIKDIGRQLYVDQDARQKFINNLLTYGLMEDFENLDYKKDGTVFWASMSARIVKDEKGNPAYIQGFVTDITKRKDAEAALHTAERQYRGLVEQIPAAVYTDAPEDNLNSGIYVSPQIEAISGYSADEWTKTRGFWPNHIHPDDLQSYINENDRTNRTGEPFNIEYRIISKSGKVVWLRDNAKLTYDENGKPLYWQGILLDITDKKLADQQLESSEESYRTLIEQAADGIFISDPEGRYIDVNSSGCVMLGYTRAEILNMNMHDLLAPEELQTKPLRLRELRSGQTFIVQRDFRKKDGTFLPVEISSKALSDGRVLGIVRDITERIQAEEIRIQEQRRFRSLIENSTDAIGLYSPDGTILYESPAIEKIVDFRPQEVEGKKIFDFLHPDDLERSQKVLLSTLANPTTVIHFEVRHLHKNGTYRWLEFVITNRMSEPSVQALVANFRDVTERRLTEQALQESEDQYRQLVEHSPYAIAVHSNGVLVYLNQAGLKFIGAKHVEELYGTPILNFVHQDSRPRVIQRLKELEEGHDVSPLEEKFLRQDGAAVEVEVTAYPFTFQNKPAVQVVIRDLTEEKKAEKARRASEERFSKAFHASPIPTCITRLEDGCFVDVNEAYLKLSKWQRDEVIGHSLHELGVNKIADRESFINKLLKREAAQGEEDKFYTATGETSDVSTFYEVIEIGGQACILSMFYDMTEQKQAQEAIRSSEEKLRAIIENTQNIYYSHNPNNAITYISGQTEKILGYPSNEAPVNWKEFMTDHPINQRGIYLTQRAIETGETQESYVLELRRKDDRKVWVEVRETPIVRDGKTTAIVGALTDITQRKEADERLERQLAELTVLHAVATAVSQSVTEDEVIERATQIISGMLYPDSCGILLNHDRTMLKPHKSYGGTSVNLLTEEFPLTMGVTGKAAASGKSLRINDVSKEPRYMETTSGINSELCVPIRVNDRIIGVLNAESRKPEAFDEEDERLMNTVAGTLGTAMERIRLFKSEKERRLDAEHLRESTVALTTSIKLNELYDIILDSLKNLVPYDSASIEMADENNLLEIVAGQGLPNLSNLIGQKYNYSPEKWGEKAKNPLIIPDVQEDERFVKFEGTEYIHGWMGIPMLLQEKVIGYINLDSRQKNFYTSEHASIVQTFANQAAIAIKNALLYKSEQRRHQEAEKLRQAATAIASSLKLQDVLEVLLRALKDVVPFDSASILLPEGNYVRIVAAHGLPKQDLYINKLYPASNQLLQQVLTNGEPLILDDAQKDPRFEQWASSELIRGWMGIPMVARGQVTGFVTLDSLKAGIYNPATAELAQSFAHQAAIAIENAELFESLQKSNIELSQAYDTTLEGWGKALELRDKETQGHTLRVTNQTLKLATLMGCTPDQLVQIRRGTLVHDIGKMAVPDKILHKKGPLTKSEWDEMRKHPQHAFDLLYPIEYLRPALDIAYCHHEWWDGSGYPRGLRETQIPLAARIFAVVDVWDALLYERPYRAKGWPKKKILKYLQEQAGTHFDPEAVKVFVRMIEDEQKK